MKPFLLLLCSSLLGVVSAAEPEFPLTADSKPQDGVPKGRMIEDVYPAAENSVFPGTGREVKIYLPHGFDPAREWPFMVFQDGVIYQAPVVFDNLIHKGDIPPLVGIFIKPGVVPAANDNALPRFNRSYEYDSVTDTYSSFLIGELLPALEKKHGLKLSTDPNRAAIAGNSSGGICAFMAAWHRPDRFRRVFTGVGTYVGIRGADRLPVLIRKIEPKPLRVFLQSGTGDNDLYCGDWWMANQMMERSLTWAGYDVNHAWGEGGHNQKHATQVFPDALRWLWRDWQTDIEVKANPRGESKWRGYEVLADGGWEILSSEGLGSGLRSICTDSKGSLFAATTEPQAIHQLSPSGKFTLFCGCVGKPSYLSAGPDNTVICWISAQEPKLMGLWRHWPDGKVSKHGNGGSDIGYGLAVNHQGDAFFVGHSFGITSPLMRLSAAKGAVEKIGTGDVPNLCLSPDQTQLYNISRGGAVNVLRVGEARRAEQPNFFNLEEEFTKSFSVGKISVDVEGRLYVATSRGIQVCDQVGRVNCIISTPQPLKDLCLGGKDLSEMFIACGDVIYKRPTKVKGYISGQMAPIKPAPPKL
jgi:gluconolactonase